MGEFELHSLIAADFLFVADWPLCRVLLMNDARYPWLLLVPRRAGAVEIADLPAGDRALLMDEIVRAGAAIQAMQPGAKLNVGALGNIARQLHVHVVGRTPDDPAWPGPVWGHSVAVPYEAQAREGLIALVRSL
jgi:diadenosine tetraphosphate (Ap4A) HIT family hydrolase